MMGERPLTHLNAAMAYGSSTGRNCVQRSMALMLDLPGATLMFGVFPAANVADAMAEEGASRVPFIHAWVEWRGDVYAPTLVEKMGALKPLPRSMYYRVNRIGKTWFVGCHQFDSFARRWGLSAALRHQKPRAGSAEITDAILKLAGVQYVLSPTNTLLPAPDVAAPKSRMGIGAWRHWRPE